MIKPSAHHPLEQTIGHAPGVGSKAAADATNHSSRNTAIAFNVQMGRPKNGERQALTAGSLTSGLPSSGLLKSLQT
jgi:hypothetical protein